MTARVIIAMAAGLLLVCGAAAAHATTIIGVRTTEGITIAADSRGTLSDRGDVKARRDQACKLFIVGNAVFGFAGVAGDPARNYQPLKEISAILQQRTSIPAAANAIADRLRPKLLDWLAALRKSDLASFKKETEPGGPKLDVLIAGIDKDEPVETRVSLVARRDTSVRTSVGFSVSPPRIKRCSSPCVYPLGDVDRIRALVDAGRSPSVPAEAYAKRLIQLQSTAEGTTGGDVDIVVLDRNGPRWLEGKKHCRERKD